MKMILEGVCMGVKTDTSEKSNFVTVIQDGAGYRVEKVDVIYPKDAKLPAVGEEVYLSVNVKASVNEYKGKSYPRLSCFYNPSKTAGAPAAGG